MKATCFSTESGKNSVVNLWKNRLKGKPFGSPFSLFFGRLDEKKFCLLQFLRYRRVVNQTSTNCYKTIKSLFFMSTYFPCRSPAKKSASTIRHSSARIPPTRAGRLGNCCREWKSIRRTIPWGSTKVQSFCGETWKSTGGRIPKNNRADAGN